MKADDRDDWLMAGVYLCAAALVAIFLLLLEGA